MSEPVRASLPSKPYFRIGEVAALVGVEPHVLRYWEREFRTIRPTKSTKGQRVYSRRDVETLMRVRELLYEEGFTIAGARKQLSGPEPSSGAAAADVHARLRALLLTMRGEIESFLDELAGTPSTADSDD